VPQEQEQRRVQRREEAPAASDRVEATAKGQELAEEMDDIIDEIDAVLEQNAEEFVKSYVQKGGE
jgi:ubiquitin-like protein Pup